jgi:hypothetical protein
MKLSLRLNDARMESSSMLHRLHGDGFSEISWERGFKVAMSQGFRNLETFATLKL